jgi:ketosteroid isomerase-like protein
MTPPTPLDTVLAYLEQINRHDVGKICSLMTDDHEFVDSLGSLIRGKAAMRQAWIGYFYLIPDYRIAFTQSFASGDSVAVFGTARGTYAPGGAAAGGSSWEMPLAVRARVRNGLVARWEVYADNEPVRSLIASAGEKPPAP